MHEWINDWYLCEDTKSVVSIEVKLLKQSLTNTGMQSNFYKDKLWNVELSYDWNNLWAQFQFCCYLYQIDIMTVCSYHVAYACHSESTLYSCLNVKELIAQNGNDIWSLSDCNRTRTDNHLVRKLTLNHCSFTNLVVVCVCVCVCVYFLPP